MSAGASAGGTFDFASNGDLVLDQTSGTFGAAVSGLTNSGQILDFANIQSTGATFGYVDSGGSGTLTVSSGGNTVSVNVIGTYSAGSFKTSADAGGGFEIFDPPAVPNGGVATPNSVTPGNGSPPESTGSTTAGDDAADFGDANSGQNQLVAGGAKGVGAGTTFGFGATSGAGQEASGFDHALFTNYAAALSDGKAFGSNGAATSSDHGDPANLAAAVTDPATTHHHK